jgi:hypothetical protein
MVSLTKMGAVIFPPVPAFYHRPKTLDDVINQTVSRVLDQFGIDLNLFKRWSDEQLKRHPDAAKGTLSNATGLNRGRQTATVKPVPLSTGRRRNQAIKKRR